MKVTKCIIVDDEPLAIRILESYIASIPQLCISKICNNAFEAMNIIYKEKVDLMILDIHMPDFIGTELIKILHSPPKIIFTTADKEFAHKAFDLDAVDYLLKSFSFERFLRGMNKYWQIIPSESHFNPNEHKFLYFRAERKIMKVYLDNILYIESLKDYIVIHLKNETSLKIKLPIGTVENMLPPHLFMRVHRSFIVAVDKITAFIKHEVEIKKIEIPIGRSYPNVFTKLSPSDSNLSEEVL